MIEYINARLNDWSEWVATGRKVEGLGYPSQVSFMRLTPSSGGNRAPSWNEDAYEVELAVNGLEHPLKELIFQFYLHPGTVQSHAKALRICRDTLYVRLHQAHIKVMEYLSDSE